MPQLIRDLLRFPRESRARELYVRYFVTCVYFFIMYCTCGTGVLKRLRKHPPKTFSVKSDCFQITFSRNEGKTRESVVVSVFVEEVGWSEKLLKKNYSRECKRERNTSWRCYVRFFSRGKIKLRGKTYEISLSFELSCNPRISTFERIIDYFLMMVVVAFSNMNVCFFNFSRLKMFDRNRGFLFAESTLKFYLWCIRPWKD